MNLKVNHVDTNYVQQVWPMVKPFLEEAMTKGGDFPDWAQSYTIEHIQVFLTSGAWLLVVAVDEENTIHGAATISFINYPLHRVAFITTTGGKFIANPEVIGQLKALVKLRGATKMQAFCRESMVRLLTQSDFEPRNTLVEVLI
jgi:hypothetical protein